MILNVSAKSITLLLAFGVTSTTGSNNLRQRRTTLFGHGHNSEPVSHQVEASPVARTQNLRGSDVSIDAAQPPPASVEVESASESESTTTKKSGMLKYHKGTKKSTERQHAIVSKPLVNANALMHAEKTNSKIATGSGLEMMPESSSFSAQQETSSNSISAEAEQQGHSKSTITSDKPEYELDESVTVDFTIDASQHPQLTKYKIGIFMRMAHPQGGALDPVVSLPLPLAESHNDRGVSAGSVTFSSESMEDLLIGSWPIDLYQWGTGFDAYVLDGDGNDVVGPVRFNIMMDDTY